jgi:two-component system, NarL family, invasion response regulator UvrY
VRILLADDHEVFRKGLILLLGEKYPNAKIGEAMDSAETLEFLSRRAWDILILDIFMPGRSGLEVLHEARRDYPKLPVLVLSSAPDDQLALRVLKSGASGYLNKRVAAEELVKAVEKLASGGRYISPAIAEILAADAVLTERAPHASLSDREFEVLRLLVAGRSIKEIASELSLSAKTVSTFHIRIWEKLRVQNDIEMTRYAIEHELA